MSGFDLARYVTPWKYKRQRREAERLRALKLRDGENCARCRRPIRFDLPRGHDQGARIEEIVPTATGSEPDLSNLRLTHLRCNASGVDHTGEVTERIRRKNEAELFSKKRKRA
jgi:5-methylcytosine-specific restriction endonuclease McrA